MSSYYYIRVLILLCMCPHTTPYVYSYHLASAGAATPHHTAAATPHHTHKVLSLLALPVQKGQILTPVPHHTNKVLSLLALPVQKGQILTPVAQAAEFLDNVPPTVTKFGGYCDISMISKGANSTFFANSSRTTLCPSAEPNFSAVSPECSG